MQAFNDDESQEEVKRYANSPLSRTNNAVHDVTFQQNHEGASSNQSHGIPIV